MKVRIDHNRCIGAATCVEICPEVFELREDGLAQLKEESLEPSLYDAVLEAAEECLAEAIIVEEI